MISFSHSAVLALVFFIADVPGNRANDNGLAKTPPLGWRSWNLYGGSVNQTLIESIMKGMVSNKRPIWTGETKSLCDLGYCDVGLDDNWQSCGDARAADGMNYHDANGNPIVNTHRFPDFKKMTDHAHSLKLTSGWYGNNCICSDHCRNATECEMQIKGDVAALVKYNFDSWKLDGCGGETDLVTFNKYVKELSPKPIKVENCHWGSKVPFKPDRSKPPAEGCPWNFYRSSGDVRASYTSILYNLGTVFPLRSANLSYPGCWAYPDMLQVGCKNGPGGKGDPGLSIEEARTHFGSWAIVSSPLTLSHDVNDDTVTDKVWDIITNTEVLGVNQAYVGDSGGMFKSSSETVTLTDAHIEASDDEEAIDFPSWMYLSKPMGSGKVAVLLMNSANASQTLTLDFADVPALPKQGGSYAVRDIWNHKDMGEFENQYAVQVASHDAAFIIISN